MGLIYSPAAPNEYEQKHLSWRGDERKKNTQENKGERNECWGRRGKKKAEK